jgi:putative SOS response-associated peptidase YedK
VCGRYALTADLDALALEFEVDASTDVQLPARWNIAPTSDIYIVREREAQSTKVRELLVARWGLIPSWAKDPSIGSRLANARAETVAEKPAFRSAFKDRRCLVLCDGWYEWLLAQTPVSGRRPPKQPYLMKVDGRPHAAFAGLYEWWRAPGADPDEPALLTANLLTTDAVGPAADVHDRMPVILDSNQWARWLDPAAGEAAPEVLAQAIQTLPQQPVTVRPVTPDVNSVRNDGAYLWGEFFPPDEAPDSGGASSVDPSQTLF